MSSNDCDGDSTDFFLGVDAALLLSSLGMDGNDLLSLMLFMVAATLGIALTQTSETALI